MPSGQSSGARRASSWFQADGVVGECRCRLSVTCGDGRDAMNEMQIDIGIGAQREKMIVVVGRRRGGDGNVGGRYARREQRPDPTQCLDCLMVSGRGTDGSNGRRLSIASSDRNAAFLEPGRDRAGT